MGGQSSSTSSISLLPTWIKTLALAVLLWGFIPDHPEALAKTCNLHKGQGGSTRLYIVCTDTDPNQGPSTWLPPGELNLNSHGAPTIATDGSRWCASYIYPRFEMVGLFPTTYYDIHVACTPVATDPRFSSSWSSVRLGNGWQAYETPSIATDGKKWCIMVKGMDPRLWLMCSTDPLNAGSWTIREIASRTDYAPSLATDGKRWCAHFRGQSTNTLWIGCLEGDPMSAPWSETSLNLSSRIAPSLATDGKQWCSMHQDSVSGKTNLYIACVKGNPMVSANWTATNLDPKGTGGVPSLSTDGRQWCSMVRGTADEGLAILCTNSDPSEANGWSMNPLQGWASTHMPAITHPKGCLYAGEPSTSVSNCCTGLRLEDGKCQAPTLPLTPYTMSAIGEACSAAPSAVDRYRFRVESSINLALYEHLFAKIDKATIKSKYGSLEKLVDGARIRRVKILAAQETLKVEKAKLVQAGEALRNFSSPDASVRDPAKRTYTQLTGRTPTEAQVEYRWLYDEMNNKVRGFLEAIIGASSNLNKDLLEAKKMAANEDWLCEKTSILNCGIRRWTKAGAEEYYVDMPLPGEEAPNITNAATLPENFAAPQNGTINMIPRVPAGTQIISQANLDSISSWMANNGSFKSYANPLVAGMDGGDANIPNAGQLVWQKIKSYAFVDTARRNPVVATPTPGSALNIAPIPRSTRQNYVLQLQTHNAFIISYLEANIGMLARRNSSQCAASNSAENHLEEFSKGTDGTEHTTTTPAEVGLIEGSAPSNANTNSAAETGNIQGTEVTVSGGGGSESGSTVVSGGGGGNTGSTSSGGSTGGDVQGSSQAADFRKTTLEEQQNFTNFTQTPEGKQIGADLQAGHTAFLASTGENSQNQGAFSGVKSAEVSQEGGPSAASSASSSSGSNNSNMNVAGIDSASESSVGDGNGPSRGKDSYGGSDWRSSSSPSSSSSYRGGAPRTGGTYGSSGSGSGPGGSGASPGLNDKSAGIGLSTNEKDVILRSVGPRHYKFEETDGLFDRITKTYLRVALPRLLKEKK